MLNKFQPINVIIKFIIPYIILYAIYIQLNGEISPGGGFQAGVIFTSALIAYDLLSNDEQLKPFISINSLIICAVTGVAIYLTTGFISMIFGGNYLNYSLLANNKITGQHIGIFIIEIGVGLTVSSVLFLIYSLLQEQKN